MNLCVNERLFLDYLVNINLSSPRCRNACEYLVTIKLCSGGVGYWTFEGSMEWMIVYAVVYL